MLWAQPRPNGDSGATSLVTCRRCRSPTLLLVSDRLSQFSQPLPSRTIPRFNNCVAAVLLAETNPFGDLPGTPAGIKAAAEAFPIRSLSRSLPETSKIFHFCRQNVLSSTAAFPGLKTRFAEFMWSAWPRRRGVKHALHRGAI